MSENTDTHTTGRSLNTASKVVHSSYNARPTVTEMDGKVAGCAVSAENQPVIKRRRLGCGNCNDDDSLRIKAEPLSATQSDTSRGSGLFRVLERCRISFPTFMFTTWSFGWWRSTLVERRSLAGELSLSCARPAADGWPQLWVSHPLQVSQLG